MIQRRYFLTAASLLALPAARAARFPERPINLIVPFPPGGGTDVHLRKFAQLCERSLGQPVIVENRPGASGSVALTALARNARSDGYTISVLVPTSLRLPLLQKMHYDPLKDFSYLSRLSGYTYVVAVRSDSPWKTWSELVDYARANPGKLTYGSSGVGGAHHLSGELLAFQTKTQMTHVPYKGGSLAATDLMGGHLAFMFEMGYSALPSIKAGKINALAVSSRERLKVLPNVPTLDEAGVKGFESYNWLGMIAPASAPDAVVAKLNAAVNAALKRDDLKHMIEGSGGIVVGGTPQAFGEFIAQERAKWAPVIKSANITLD